MPCVERKQESRFSFKSPLPICSNSHINLRVFLPQTYVIQMTPNLHIKSKDLLDMSDIQISKNRRNLGVFLPRMHVIPMTLNLHIKVKWIVGYAPHVQILESTRNLEFFLPPNARHSNDFEIYKSKSKELSRFLTVKEYEYQLVRVSSFRPHVC